VEDEIKRIDLPVGLGEAAGTENPETFGIDVEGPPEPGLARATEKLDDLLIGGITKNHGLAATADERQFAFDLATVEALGEVTSLNASSGSTGPLRDSRIAGRRRLRRVCSSASSAVTLRWFFRLMGEV
jgi:hypothetical protein